MTSPGISVRGLKKAFGSTKAVDDLSLEIEPGELFFLLGPSGCGKTTLLRCIAGFCKPDAGTILIGGREVTPLPPHLRDTAMVFQSYALWPHMTVRENVAFALKIRKLPRAEIHARTDEALRLVRLSDRAEHRPAQLSGGQQQRVALARAWVSHPQCLLLDEPLSNLDAKLRLEMRTEIRRICKETGLTGVYVTHDQKEALAIADRLVVLHNGRMEQCGRPHDVYRRPANRFVAHFIGETNFIEGVVESVGDGSVGIRVADMLWRGSAPSGEALRPGESATLSIRPEHLRLDSVPPHAPNGIAGAVCDTNYLGDVVLQKFRPDATALPELKIYELRPSVLARDGAQTRATAWVDPADVIVLRK